MTHLLHEVKDELDWAVREVQDVEDQYSKLEDLILTARNTEAGGQRDTLIQDLTDQKEALKLSQLYDILDRAARRFSLLTRVFQVGSQHSEIEDIVIGLTDGLLFNQGDTSAQTDDIIFQTAEVLQNYFHYQLNDESDAQLRDAWLEVEGVLRELGRKI
ncbi:MAG: hypothetical protein JKY17_03340 [Magnetovibrio sp.]|nr:hypothetical protein [Magnetovibrio sp.]